MEEPRHRDVDILVEGGKGGGSGSGEVGVVLRDPKSGESVSLGMGPSYTWG